MRKGQLKYAKNVKRSTPVNAQKNVKDAGEYIKEHVSIIIVHYNTPELLRRALNSIPPNIKIIIVENSEIPGIYKQETLFPPKQMFHGDGLHFGIQHITTPYFVAMDSDAYIKDAEILNIMHNILIDKPNTYGIGYVARVDKNGRDDWAESSKSPYFDYLHPYFCMINTQHYHKSESFVHHGAPAIYSSQDAIKKGYTMHNLTLPVMREYVHHDGRGTRDITKEYVKGWDIRD